jgi:hypothetical protein
VGFSGNKINLSMDLVGLVDTVDNINMVDNMNMVDSIGLMHMLKNCCKKEKYLIVHTSG